MTPFAIQFLAAVLFAIGLGVMLTRRNMFFVLMGIELLLNAVNLSFVGFSQSFAGDAALTGQIAPLFVIALAAAEACIGLAMLICIAKRRNSLDVDAYSDMRE